MSGWTGRRCELILLVGLTIVVNCSLNGCTRGHYRMRADADAYARLIEKSCAKPWSIPGDYSVYPAPHSRLHDPTCVNDPRLPSPSPQLYEYELPELPKRDLGRFRPNSQLGNSLSPDSLDDVPANNFPANNVPANNVPFEVDPSEEIPPADPIPPSSIDESTVPPTESEVTISGTVEGENQAPAAEFVTRGQNDSQTATKPIVQRFDDVPVIDTDLDEVAEPNVPSPAATTQATDGTNNEDVEPDIAVEDAAEPTDDDVAVQTTQVPLPPSYWESIPTECLARMFEFKTVRDEYLQTYGNAPRQAQLDDSPKLALEDIIQLTLLNSRELQTQKESLYRAALALSLQRFDYQLRPSLRNNGSGANFAHNRAAGITDNTLGVPTTLQLERTLYSGANFIGRFANDVLLTFNGPSGFAVDVGSDLLFNFSQTLLQRDVQLENLTQAERNVVYATRDFTRFRRELFVQQASDYYSLIRQFRQIEIQCQNYFTLAREFNQRSVEIKFGFAARTQLDQVEQQVINGRQSILSACTSLENALDSLKIRMGLPTEQPLNLDLSELNLITLSDELAVNAELIERARRRILEGMGSAEKSPTLLVASGSDLAEQLLDSLRLRKALGEASVDSKPLEYKLLGLRVEEADIEVAEAENELRNLLAEEDSDPTPIALFLRRRNIVEALYEKYVWQLRLLEKDETATAEVEAGKAAYEDFGNRLANLRQSFLEISKRAEAEADEPVNEDNNLEELEQQLIAEAESLQNDMERFAAQLDQSIGRTVAVSPAEFEARAAELANDLLTKSDNLRDGAGGGLVPIEIEMDDAMMTALVQRFDLMNQRGFLADDWRLVKYAADDLKSILNLNASQRIRTRSNQNKPFEFSFDDSTTTAGVSLDLPFNRRAQRNSFRTSIFDYQQTLRGVMQLEDGIKLNVRRDLRTLKLDRQQYANDVAGAALASVRVKGTEAEVRLGQATSRDFLESQQAYVQAISGVASDHINYIVGRLQLFLDLESLKVGDNGFWDELYDEDYQPAPSYQLPAYARPGYGNLHPRLRYSKLIRRMRCVPDGVSMVHKHEEEGEEADLK